MTKLVAVVIDKDKASQSALKWALDNILVRGQTVILVHVRLEQSFAGGLYKSPSSFSSWPVQMPDGSEKIGDDIVLRELFLPFRILCKRKDIQQHEVVLDDTDVVRVMVNFVKQSTIDILVLGAAIKGGIFRFKAKDIPGIVLKCAPDFCTVHVIHKGKISSTRSSFHPPPASSEPFHFSVSKRTRSAAGKDVTSEEVPLPPWAESHRRSAKGRRMATSRVTPTVDLDPEAPEEHPISLFCKEY